MRPVLEGLERVHAAGVLHRDIKPSNILIRRRLGRRREERSGGVSSQCQARPLQQLNRLSPCQDRVTLGAFTLSPWRACSLSHARRPES